MNESEINIQRITVSDKNMVPRVCIASPAPDPKVDGTIYKRDTTITGIQLMDCNGNELGGIGVMDDQRAAVFALDYSKHEAVGMYAFDTPEAGGACIFINGKDKKAEVMGSKKYSKAELKIENDSPVLTFSGKDGRPRIIIGLDENDNPVIQVLGKDGQMRSLIE
ncbi:MAG: hypothetical protein GYA78_04845 [Caldisericales bacterium]|jgi:hypothetical protein|nr:hypothetical protein [Caldisericales bacterium]